MTATMIASGCTVIAKFDEQYLYISNCCLLMFKNIILVVAICRIKDFIRTIEVCIPNEKLILVHYINVTIYTMLFVIYSILYIEYVNQKERGNKLLAAKIWFAYSIFIGLIGIFQLYNCLFLYCLFLKQTRTKDKKSFTDAVLNKEVPSLVYV